jgi:hypothetical protein
MQNGCEEIKGTQKVMIAENKLKAFPKLQGKRFYTSGNPMRKWVSLLTLLDPTGLSRLMNISKHEI